MKKVLSLIILFGLSITVFSQITLELQRENCVYFPVQLSSSGTKYLDLEFDSLGNALINQNLQFNLRNLDGSLYKTINLPPKPSPDATILALFYLSETLFDNDPSNFEFMIIWILPNYTTPIQIVREDGTILLEEPNSATWEVFTSGKYYSVYETDQGTKMLLYCYNENNQFTGIKIFSLQGFYPTENSPIKNNFNNGIALYPNPNQGEFIIENNNEYNLRLNLYNSNGMNCGSFQAEKGINKYFTILSSGIYFLKVNDDTKVNQSTKLIIISK